MRFTVHIDADRLFHQLSVQEERTAVQHHLEPVRRCRLLCRADAHLDSRQAGGDSSCVRNAHSYDRRLPASFAGKPATACVGDGEFGITD